MKKDLDACAREVGQALSRYDGYSTYAKLESIIGIPASPIFDEKPSCYVADIVADAIQAQGGEGRPRHVENRVKHAISLGLLEKVASGGRTPDMVIPPHRFIERIALGGKVERVAIPHRQGKKKRGVHLSDNAAKMSNATMKVTLSPMGRACRAAIRMGNGEFRDFLVTRVLLDRDFDMCGLMLKCALENKDGEVVREEFSRELSELLLRRKDWLEAVNKSSPMAADRIRNHVPWASSKRALTEESSFRHHFNMRREWIAHLGYLDQNRRFLTDKGRNLIGQICDAVRQNAMFWLAPSPECAKKLGIGLVNSDAACSAWEMLRPPESNAEPKITEEIAAFMKSAFTWTHISVLAQAPLASVIPYVYFLEDRRNERVKDMREFFADILRKHRDIRCTLRGILEDTQYRLQEKGSASEHPNPLHTAIPTGIPTDAFISAALALCG